jgi:hypothetical protein
MNSDNYPSPPCCLIRECYRAPSHNRRGSPPRGSAEGPGLTSGRLTRETRLRAAPAEPALVAWSVSTGASRAGLVGRVPRSGAVRMA